MANDKELATLLLDLVESLIKDGNNAQTAIAMARAIAGVNTRV